MLLHRDKSGFVLVDVQEKLTSHVLQPEALVTRCDWLVRLVKALNVPLLVSEQYPSGLGKTVEPLRKATMDDPCIDKVYFSCYRDKSFVNHWDGLGRKQVVIAGIETHVCVLQTAIDMVDSGLDVFVVVDAVSSRHKVDHRYGLKRMKQAGVHLVTAEMVFFEWVGCAGTAEFKTLSQSFLR
jgi:nicotinamidase-related amidase